MLVRLGKTKVEPWVKDAPRPVLARCSAEGTGGVNVGVTDDHSILTLHYLLARAGQPVTDGPFMVHGHALRPVTLAVCALLTDLPRALDPVAAAFASRGVPLSTQHPGPPCGMDATPYFAQVFGAGPWELPDPRAALEPEGAMSTGDSVAPAGFECPPQATAPSTTPCSYYCSKCTSETQSGQHCPCTWWRLASPTGPGTRAQGVLPCPQTSSSSPGPTPPSPSS